MPRVSCSVTAHSLTFWSRLINSSSAFSRYGANDGIGLDLFILQGHVRDLGTHRFKERVPGYVRRQLNTKALPTPA